MDDAEVGITTYKSFLSGIAAGHVGGSIQMMLERLGGGHGDYTVYWPKDSIRVIPGSSYAVARTVFCILREEGTVWMGEPTATERPIIARVRRELSPAEIASVEQVRSARVFKRDLMLPADIRTHTDDDLGLQLGVPSQTFDFASLPEL